MQALLGLSASIITIIGYIPYIRDILRRKVKPHKVTWLVWTILTSIVAFNQVLNEGGYSSLFFISTSALVGVVFLLSLRFGVGGASKIDRVCLVLALGLLLYWVTLQETRTSTLVAVFIDVIGFTPTLLKTYKDPDSETYIQWTLSGIAGFLAVLAVPRLDWVLVIYPIYIIIGNGSIVGIKYFREKIHRDHSSH